MVAGKVVATGAGDSLELMIRKHPSKVSSGCSQGVEEFVVRIIHTVNAVDGLKAALVKTGIVRHQGQALDERGNLLPDAREHRRVHGVIGTKAMHAHAEPLVVLRLRVDQAVEPVHDLPVAHNHYTHAAHA